MVCLCVCLSHAPGRTFDSSRGVWAAASYHVQNSQVAPYAVAKLVVQCNNEDVALLVIHAVALGKCCAFLCYLLAAVCPFP